MFYCIVEHLAKDAIVYVCIFLIQTRLVFSKRGLTSRMFFISMALIVFFSRRFCTWSFSRLFPFLAVSYFCSFFPDSFSFSAVSYFCSFFPDSFSYFWWFFFSRLLYFISMALLVFFLDSFRFCFY